MELIRTNPADQDFDLKNQSIRDLAAVLSLRTIFTGYTLENVSLGRIAPKQKIPFVSYIRELDLKCFNPYRYLDQLDSPIISNDLTVVDKDKTYFYEFLFCDSMNLLFCEAPRKNDDIDYDNDYDLFNFSHGLREFVVGLYPFFASILSCNVDYDPFDIMPRFNRREYFSHRNKMITFLYAIKRKGLRQGSIVDRYFKNFFYIPTYLNRIVEFRDKHYRIKNNDTNSLDYKLALLNSILFFSEENANLFEMKTKKWEESKMIILSYHLKIK